MNNSDYIPALSFSWPTWFYYPVVAVTTRERIFRQKLLEQAVFDEGMSYALPYAAGEFNVVFSSLFFHHLKVVNKLRTMEEAGFSDIKMTGQVETMLGTLDIITAVKPMI